jgi:hypothetical protein
MAQTKTPLSRERAAQLYIQAHRDAHYTNLPAEHKQARLDILRDLEHQDPSVRERALVGAPRHTGTLNPSERSHQTYMRDQAGISHAELLERRRALDKPPGTSSPGGHGSRGQSRPAPSRPVLPRASAGQRRAARTIAHATPSLTGGKNITIKVIGIIVALSVLYLIISKRGSGAFSAILGIGTGVVKNFLGSGDILTDPLAASPASTAGTAANPLQQTAAGAASLANVAGSIANANPFGALPTAPSSSANLGRAARTPARPTPQS